MMRKKWPVLILALLMMLASLSGCTADPNEIIAKVGETPIYRWNFEVRLQSQLALYEQYYGTDLSLPSQAEDLADLKESVLESLIEVAAMKDGARELGLDQLTPEQEAEVDASYNAYYESTMQSFLDEHGTDEAGVKKAEEAYAQFLSDNGLNVERVMATLRDDYIASLYLNEISDAPEVTDEQVKEEYDRLLADQKERGDENPASLSEAPPYLFVYAPVEYKMVARIALHFTDQKRAEISTYEQNLIGALSAYQSATMQFGAESSEAKKANDVFADASILYDSTLNEATETLTKEFNETVKSPLDAGTNFDTLLSQVTEDSNPIPYYISEQSSHVSPQMRDAAMALSQEGEVNSGPLTITEGLAAIMLVETIPAGERAFEEVESEIRDYLTTTQNASASFQASSKIADEAYEAGKVTIYDDMQ